MLIIQNENYYNFRSCRVRTFTHTHFNFSPSFWCKKSVCLGHRVVMSLRRRRRRENFRGSRKNHYFVYASISSQYSLSLIFSLFLSLSPSLVRTIHKISLSFLRTNSLLAHHHHRRSSMKMLCISIGKVSAKLKIR